MFGCNRQQQNQSNSQSKNVPTQEIGTVNGQVLSFKAYEWKLKSGCEALGDCKEGNKEFEELREGIVSNLIDNALIVEEAKKRNLTVTPEVITKAVNKEIKTMGGDVPYSEFLKKYNLTADEHREILKATLTEKVLLENFGKDLIFTDQETEAYYKEHKDEFNPPDESGKKLTLVQATPQIVEMLRTGKAKEMMSSWLNETRKKAVVKLNEAYRFGKLKTEFPNTN